MLLCFLRNRANAKERCMRHTEHVLGSYRKLRLYGVGCFVSCWGTRHFRVFRVSGDKFRVLWGIEIDFICNHAGKPKVEECSFAGQARELFPVTKRGYYPDSPENNNTM